MIVFSYIYLTDADAQVLTRDNRDRRKKGKKRVGAQTLKSALSVGYFLKRGLSPSDLMSPRWVIERVEESAENIENE